MEYSLADFIAILRKRCLQIVICTFIGLLLFFAVNRFMKQPYYTASVQMYVEPSMESSSADLNELTYAQKIIATYVYILRAKVFYEQVLEECELNYTANQLRALTTIEPINNTEIFQISVTTNSAEDSYQLVKTMQMVVPDFIKNIKNLAKISVIDPVTKPVGPAGPNIRFHTMVGGFLGFILAVMASFLWEMLDIKVKNQDDLLKKYQLPILGAVPSVLKHSRNRRKILKELPFLNKHFKEKYKQKDISKKTEFEVKEAYNELRSNLRFTISKNDCKKIIINSPIPEDGKSTTSANIAIAIAKTGSKVLLIDCDLRKGRIHNFFHINNKPGISDSLSGIVNEKEVIQSTPYENLHVIAMGTIPPNPTELLGSSKMEEIILKFENNYNYIIIDTPPVNVVPDVLSLTKLSDGIVIVVCERVTSHPDIVKALNKYRLADAEVLGFVINEISRKQEHKLKSHYYK